MLSFLWRKYLERFVCSLYASSLKKSKRISRVGNLGRGGDFGRFSSFLNVFFQILIHNMPSQQNTIEM
jgi:hypothetical protein